MKSAFLGAGYISKFHNINGLFDLIGVADLHKEKAAAFNTPNPVNNLNELLTLKPDVVHILTPPETHISDGIKVLENGSNLFLEKLMGLSLDEAQKLLLLSKESGLKVGVNHNFLFYPVYEKLILALRKEELGPIDHVSITWFRELEIIKSGPFNKWMISNPRNLLFELGSHLAAIYIDILGEPETLKVIPSDPITLPTGVTIYRRVDILGFQGKTSGHITLSVRAGMDERKVEVRGLNGIATVDFDANTFFLKRNSHRPLDFDRYYASKQESKAIKKQAFRTLINYILSKFNLSRIKDPYSYSIERSIRTFYDKGQDVRQSPEFGVKVVKFCEKAAEQIPDQKIAVKTYPPLLTKPKLLILGASGFIGQALLKELKEPVRVLGRSAIHHPLVESINGSLENEDDVKRSLDGIETVIHLARARVNTWNEYVEKEVKVNEKLAKLAKGVKRFIYTGTIDSYYAGKGRIDEHTPLDPKINERNYYARAKALSEQAFLDLPYVILRPGIVLGKGSSPFHFGVGKFSTNGTDVELWGNGKNPLPLVLVEDVAKALILATTAKEIEKESFILTSPPLLTALEYIEELERALHNKIEIIPTYPFENYINDLIKWIVKIAINHPNRKTPSYRDWQSRTQKAVFDSSKAEKLLHWKPVKEKALFIEKGIVEPVKEWLA